jgi:hypothetical protein
VNPDSVVGAWRLESFNDVDASGRTTAGPLGPDPTGMLLYTPDGRMSVSMMRTSPGMPAFMGYAGRWRIDAGRLVHRILVSSRADWVGAEQIRHAELDGDLLRITADNPVDGRLQGRVVGWRRIVPD